MRLALSCMLGYSSLSAPFTACLIIVLIWVAIAVRMWYNGVHLHEIPHELWSLIVHALTHFGVLNGNVNAVQQQQW